MSVLERLDQIRNKLNEGRDVFLQKESFVAIIQESTLITAWNKGGLMIIVGKPEARMFVTFNCKSEAFVQVIKVEMPRTWNSGALFAGKVDVV